jgi:hypothetical protein
MANSQARTGECRTNKPAARAGGPLSGQPADSTSVQPSVRRKCTKTPHSLHFGCTERCTEPRPPHGAQGPSPPSTPTASTRRRHRMASTRRPRARSRAERGVVVVFSALRRQQLQVRGANRQHEPAPRTECGPVHAGVKAKPFGWTTASLDPNCGWAPYAGRGSPAARIQQNQVSTVSGDCQSGGRAIGRSGDRAIGGKRVARWKEFGAGVPAGTPADPDLHVSSGPHRPSARTM